MYAPRVFMSMIGVLVVFATAAYLMTGSLVISILETALCAVILQVGYFVGILYLVRREKVGADADKNSKSRRARRSDTSNDDIRAETAARMPVGD